MHACKKEFQAFRFLWPREWYRTVRVIMVNIYWENSLGTVPRTSHALNHLLLTITQLRKVCGILMPITEMKKLALKDEMISSASHSWELVKLEFKSKQSGSRFYTLNNAILMRNGWDWALSQEKKNINYKVLELERTLKIIQSNLVLPVRKRRQRKINRLV